MNNLKRKLGEVVRLHGPLVKKRCLVFVGDACAAEDLVQEVFLKLWEAILQPSRDREDIPWALVEAIMRRVFLEYLRAKRKTPASMDIPPWLAYQADTPPPQESEREEQRQALRRCVDALAPQDQQIILGRYYLGMSAAELANYFGLLRVTFYYRHDRAMRRLRKMAIDRGLLRP